KSKSDSDSDTMNKKGSLSTTTSEFEKRAYESGILGPNSSKPAQDLDTLRLCLARRRNSTHPSENAHEKYHRLLSGSHNGITAPYDIQFKIMKGYNGRQYGKMNGRAITHIPEEDFNKGLSNPIPDRLEGLVTDELPSHMHSHALHSTNSLALCHFTTEFKRTDGNLHQARYQTACDGATLVYARKHALAQAAAAAAAVPGHSSDIEKAAKETAVLTCVTNGKFAEVFAHHFQDGEYHQNLVACETCFPIPTEAVS
ncbi:hypothetical protein B0T25DRAFT_456628, partial [Lasiosphaeria hispida]